VRRGREEKESEEKKSEKKNIQKTEDQREQKKVEKSRNTVFFQCFVAPGDGKVGSLKRGVRSQPSGQMRDQKVHAIVARSTS